MFCGNCGKENKDGMRFCTGCGKELQEIKQNNPAREAQKSEKKGKGIIPVLVILGVIVLIILLCVLLGNKDSDSKDSGKSKSKVEKEKDKESPGIDTNTVKEDEDYDNELSVLEQIVAPTCKDEVVNKQGNSANNLAYQCALIGANPPEYTGRVTAQGESVYYYKTGRIYRMDGNENIIEICSAANASSLNVIGDTLYYLRGNVIYAVDVTGGEPKEIITDAIGTFFVYGESLYFINCENKTGTTYNFYVNEYSLKKNKVVNYINTGNNKPTLVSVNPDKNGEVVYYYQQNNQSYPKYEANAQPYDLVIADFDGKKEVYSFEESFDSLGSANGYVLIDEESIYVTKMDYFYPDFIMYRTVKETYETVGYVEALKQDWYNLRTPKNCYNNELIFGIIAGNGYGLYRIPFERIAEITEQPGMLEEALIISEQEIIREAYVLGEYIYYTIDEYYEARLYRVKIDGTGWEEL